MITHICPGGLCNSILQIFNVFMFCRDRNIDFSNIKFNIDSVRWFKINENKKRYEYPFIKNSSFFNNINKYFYSQEVINEELSTVKHTEIRYIPSERYNIPYTNNIIFTGANFPSYFTLVNNIQLFKQLFYNIESINSTLQDNEKFIQEKIIGIHCRRSDFKYTDYNKYIISDDFIENILKSNDRTVAIFSDEIDYYKNRFNNYKNILFIQNDKPYKDIYLMGHCYVLYTTQNSTFSLISKVFNKIIQEKL